MQDRFELKKADGQYITEDELYDLVKSEIVEELDSMYNEDALYLGNYIRENNGDNPLYENEEDNINEQLEDWKPWDIIQLDYESYAEFFYMDYGEPCFTDDVWEDLDTDEIAEDILDGSYARYLNDDIKDILADWEEAKEFLKNLNPVREEGRGLLAKFTNCEADVTNLLQYIDRLVRNDEVWEKE